MSAPLTSPLSIPHERVAHACVCCGSSALNTSPAVLMPFVAHRVFGWAPARIDDSWGLKTIQNGMAYSICNSLFCTQCHHLFLDIRFSDAEMAALYADYHGPEYVALREQYEPGYTAKNAIIMGGMKYMDAVESLLRPFVQFPVRVLDWGGDTGINAPFKSDAALIHVYDISEVEAVPGAQRVDKATALATTYDLVICSNVLEHVSYPAEMLHEISQAMDAHAILYIEVPQEEVMRSADFASHLPSKKRHWHEHINFFSETSLRAALDACGFTILALTTLDSVHVFQLVCQKKRTP